MKKYKLLKDLPFAKTGEIFCTGTGKRNGISEITLVSENHITTHIWVSDVKNFDEWFEEVKEPKIYFTIDFYRLKVKEINTDYYSGWSALEVKNLKDSGLLFKTNEQTEKYIKYLKAKEIIKQDAKGFEPDWVNDDERKYYGYWFFDDDTADCDYTYLAKNSEIYFRTREDIEESFKKHPDEWKTYLTYEQ